MPREEYDEIGDAEYDFPVSESSGEMVICPYCNGSGEGQHEGTRCSTCKGKGEVWESFPALNNSDETGESNAG